MKKNKNKSVLLAGRIRDLLHERKMFRNVPFLVFLTVLGVIYIFNVHHAEKQMREIQALEKDIKELRWQYVGAKSQLMYNSTQSQTSIKVNDEGLGYDGSQPVRISLEENN